MSSEDFYSGRYIVIGPPGTGKTTFLSKQVKQVVQKFTGIFTESRWPNPVLVCSLTRAAAAEVAGRDLPLQKSAVGTLHAHCFRALNFPKIISKSNIEQWNSESSFPLGSTEFGEDESSGEENAWDRRADVHIETTGDSLMQRMEILRHKQTPRDLWDGELLHFAEEWDNFKSEQGVMDFTDLIEVALASISIAPGNPAVIMVDEAQDLSSLEYALIRSWGERARATIVVGDPWQALYTWRGADPSLFSDPTVPETHRRTLSQSYRVPANVLRVAVGWVKDHLSTYEPIEYAPRKPATADEDPDGECGWRESTIHDTDDIADECIRHIESGRSVMFQTTCSYMLSGLIGNLRRKFVPFANPWRKYRKDWNPLAGSGGGTTMNARLLAFVRPCKDNSQKKPWTIKDAIRFIEPMASKGVLRRGAKSKVSGLAEDADESKGAADKSKGVAGSDDLPWSADTQGVAGSSPIDDIEPISEEERDSSPVMEEDLEDWFEESVLPTISRIWRGEATVAEAADWWHQHLLGQPKKVAEYGIGLLRSMGVAGLREPPRVFVGTIHSFKGAEADVVYIFPDLSAAGFRQWQSGGGPLRDEVVRLFYVALTRAKERAYVCGNASKECAPLRRYVQKFDEE